MAQFDFTWKPKLYILRSISTVNNIMKNKFATSEKWKKNAHFNFKIYLNFCCVHMLKNLLLIHSFSETHNRI